MSNNINPAELVPYVQAIYNQFKAIGITLPLEDIPLLIWNSKSGSDGGNSLTFSTYCEDKLLALPAYANIVSLGLNRNQTLAMATLPDFSHIRTWLMKNQIASQIPAHLVQVQLLQVNNDVVSMKPGV